MTIKKKFRVKVAVGIVLAILLLIVSAVIGFVWYGYETLDKIQTIKIDKNNLGIDEDNKQNENSVKRIRNIALFGVDEEEGVTGRSDSIIIVTVDTINNKIKLSSIMRDSYVAIPENGMDKINHAYAFGGPELAIRTINENFGLNISDFVTFNFTSAPVVIDNLGGVKIDIEQDEVEYLNDYIASLGSSNFIKSPGSYNLEGIQALAYSRIRYTEGGDYKRTERQRNVLMSMFKTLKDKPYTDMPKILNQVIPMVSTSMKSDEILDLANEVLNIKDLTMDEKRFPLDENCEDSTINGVYYLTFDKEETKSEIHDFIFE